MHISIHLMIFRKSYVTTRKYLKQLENVRLHECGEGVIDLAQNVISFNNRLIAG